MINITHFNNRILHCSCHSRWMSMWSYSESEAYLFIFIFAAFRLDTPTKSCLFKSFVNKIDEIELKASTLLLNLNKLDFSGERTNLAVCLIIFMYRYFQQSSLLNYCCPTFVFLMVWYQQFFHTKKSIDTTIGFHSCYVLELLIFPFFLIYFFQMMSVISIPIIRNSFFSIWKFNRVKIWKT